MHKISIIVPVYNVEEYIHRCLDSILAQTYTNWECLLINDGSTDNSGKICYEYAEGNPKFKVFYKGNGGVSSARQYGLDNALGEWIWFVDADDCIVENALSIISERLNDRTEVLAFGFLKETKDKEIIHVKMGDSDKYTTKAYLNTLYFQSPCWCYLFKKKIIDENKIKMPTSLQYSEDRVFAMIYFSFINKVTIENRALYKYIYRENSAIHNNSKINKQVSDQAYSVEILLRLAQNKGINYQIFDYQIRKMIWQFLYFVVNYNTDKEFFKSYFISFIKNVEKLGYKRKWLYELSKKYYQVLDNLGDWQKKLLFPKRYNKEKITHIKMVITHPRYIAGWILRKLKIKK